VQQVVLELWVLVLLVVPELLVLVPPVLLLRLPLRPQQLLVP
jgi:hypothetical protein